MLAVFGGPPAGSVTPPALNQMQITDRSYEVVLATISGISSVAYVKLNSTGASPFFRDFVDLTVSNALFTTASGKARIKAYETDVDSNLFLASFRFRTSATETSCAADGYGNITGACSVRVDPTSAAGNVITVAGGSATTPPFTWKRSNTATVTTTPSGGSACTSEGICDLDSNAVADNLAGYSILVNVTVVDPELNTSATIREVYPTGTTLPVLLRATSSSDPTGETIAITEASLSTSTFSGSLGFEETNFPNNGLLFARALDTVRILYTDQADASGVARTHTRQYTFLPSSDGGVFFSSGSYFQTVASVSASTNVATGQVVVFDPDQSTTGGADSARLVRLESTDSTTTSDECDAREIWVSPAEVGGRGELFVANFNFATSLTTGADGDTDNSTAAKRLCAEHGDVITAHYTDFGRDGVHRTRTDTTKFFQTTSVGHTGNHVLRLGTADLLATTEALPDFRLRGFTVSGGVLLADRDLNIDVNDADSASVTIKSSSDPVGIPITLVETGVNTGRFTNTAPLQFVTTGSSTATHLRVANGDFVALEYVDQHDATGSLSRVISKPAVWRPDQAAQVILGEDLYFKVCNSGVPAADGKCLAANLPMKTKGEFIVVDPGRNHPLVRDVSTAKVVSGTDSTGVTITVRETGVDTGIFRGVFYFRDTATSSGGEIAVQNDGEEIQVRYTDLTGVTVSDSATWRRGPTAAAEASVNPKILRVENETAHADGFKSYVGRRDVVYIPPPAAAAGTPAPTDTLRLVYYGNLEGDVPDAGDRKFKVESKSCPQKDNGDPFLTGNMAEDATTKGRWTASFTITVLPDPNPNSPDCRSGVGVRPGDWIRFFHQPPDPPVTPGQQPIGGITGDGTTPEEVTVLSKSTPVSSWVERDLTRISQQTTGASAAGRVLLAAPESNNNARARDVTLTTIQGDGAGSGIDIVAVETGPNTGIFLTSVGFCQGTTSCPSAANAKVKMNDLNVDSTPVRDAARVNHAGHGASALGWYEAEEATMTISPFVGSDSELFGTGIQGKVEITSEDGAGVGNRVFNELFETTVAARKEFQPAGRPFVKGSELVYANTTQTNGVGGTPGLANEATTTKPITVSSKAGDAAEAITDGNLDGAVDCRDVTMTAESASGAPATITCISVNAATGEVDFTTGCTGGSDRCKIIRTTYQYRAKFDGGATVQWKYKVDPTLNPNRINFGANLQDGQGVRFEYLKAKKTIKLTSTGGTETDSIVLTASGSGATLKFTGTFQAELTQQNPNGKIKVTAPSSLITATYLDPSKPWGEGSGTDIRDYRSAQRTIVWHNTTNGAFSFWNHDYTQIRTTAAGRYVSVQYVDADGDLTDGRDVVTATGASSIDTQQFSLYETEVHSGTFRGVLEVDNDATLGEAGVLDFPVNAGGTLTVDRSDPRGAASGQNFLASKEVGWTSSQDATVSLCRVPFVSFTCATGEAPDEDGPFITGSLGALYVQVSDADANLDPGGTDTVVVTVATNRTGSLETIELGETGGSNTGVFGGSKAIKFEPFNTGATNRILAADGDTIFVRYQDPLGEQGVPVERCRLTSDGSACLETKWDRTYDGAVRFSGDFFLGEVGDTAAAGALAGLLNKTYVILPDGDLNANPNAVECYTITAPAPSGCTDLGTSLTLGSSASGAGEPFLKLYETGANTGVFIGNLTFTTGASAGESGATNARIKVAPEGRITLAYSDSTPESGSSTAKTFNDEANWYTRGRGVIVFDKARYTRLDSPVRLSLFDWSFDGTTSAVPSSRSATLQSQTDTTGITLSFSRPVTAVTGYYTATATLSLTASSGTTIKVVDNPGNTDDDTLSVTYQDADPAGPRSHTAKVRIGDTDAPVTTANLNPAVPNGENGWYKTLPTLNFTVNEILGNSLQAPLELTGPGTFYRFEQAPYQLYQEEFEVEEGARNLTYFSRDESENTETAKKTFLKVDVTAPLGVVSQVNASAGAGGSVVLTWPATNKPTDFQRYQVYRSGTTAARGNSTTGAFTDQTPSDATYQYRVTMADLAGNEGNPSPLSNAVLTDRVVPLINNPLVEPNGFDIRDGITSVTLSVTASDSNLDRVVAEVRLGASLVANVTLAGNATSGGRFTGTFSNITNAGIYQVNFRAIDKVGNAGTRNATLTVYGPDTLAPSISVSPASGSDVPQGTPIRITADDNFGISKLSYALDGAAATAVSVPAGFPLSFGFNVPTHNLALGSHTMVIEVEDKPDQGVTRKATLTMTFNVVSGGPLPSTLFVPNVKVSTKLDGSVEVRWSTPTDLGGKTLAGYIVWRAASPFQPLVKLNAAVTKYADKNTTEGAVYRYTVTWFATDGFGDVSNITLVAGYPGSDDAVPAQTIRAQAGLSGLQWFLLIGLPLIAIVLILAIVLVVRTQRRRPPSQQLVLPRGVQVGRVKGKAAEEPPAKPAPAEQRHVLRCPQCQHRFEVYGTKPIVTNCPNCGRKGILR